jgi:hypothetical protein
MKSSNGRETDVNGIIKKRRVAPGRFELPSQAPKARMIDRYTTGLYAMAGEVLPQIILFARGLRVSEGAAINNIVLLREARTGKPINRQRAIGQL